MMEILILMGFEVTLTIVFGLSGHQVTTREATRAEKVRDDWFVASPLH